LGKFYLDGEAELFVPLKYISIPKKFTFIDLFSGIGGFRIPLEELGGKCLGYSEIDAGCLQVYQKNFCLFKLSMNLVLEKKYYFFDFNEVQT